MGEPVVIIGAGAAGLMAAARLRQAGCPALLLERSGQAGRKLLVSGGGRCNFTTDRTVEEFLAALEPRGGRFLRQALHALPPAALRQWFAGLGLESVVEERRCVFPRSGRSRDVLAALLTAAGGPEILHTDCEVTGIVMEQGRALAVTTADGRHWPAAAVIVAAGGPAWPQAGGSSAGLDLLGSCGHTIAPLRPGLAPLATSPGWWRDLPGVTLPEVALVCGRRRTVGPIVTTHTGLSGPAALDASLLVDDLPAGLLLDLLPMISAEELERSLLELAASAGGRTVSSWLADRLPRRVGEALCAAAALPPQATLAQLRREDRRNLLAMLKQGPVEVTGLGDWRTAMVTVGGCDLRQVDPRTMESRLIKGLYVTGEALDLAGPTGGYNLHMAFATGWTAAAAASRIYNE